MSQITIQDLSFTYEGGPHPRLSAPGPSIGHPVEAGAGGPQRLGQDDPAPVCWREPVRQRGPHPSGPPRLFSAPGG